MKNSRIHFYLISLTSMAVCFVLQFADFTFIRDQVESKTYDLRLHLRNLVQKQTVNQDIVIVTVDENSLAQIGRWPWSRSVTARLVDGISAGKPKVIGIDIMFSERENVVSDDLMAAALKKAGNVVLATAFIVSAKERKAQAPSTAPDFLWDSAIMEVKAVDGIDWKKWAVKPASVIPPLEKLARACVLGHVTTHTDLDGVLRKEILSVNYGDDCYPSLALQVARIALGLNMKDLTLFGGSAVKLGDRLIPADLNGEVLINYVGKEGSFRYIPAVDVLQGKIGSDAFKNKIVMIGTSALATYDQKISPFSANLPGVEKNANVVQNILLNNFIRKSPGIVELAAIIATSLTLIFFIPRLKSVGGVVLGFGLIAAYFVLANIFLLYHVWINLASPVANMMVIVVTGTVTKLFAEERRAREIREMFSSYVSPKIVEVLVNNPGKAAIAGERRTVTVLFSDIIGFTTLSEKLAPEEVVLMLNEYFKEMAETIFHWDGTLDKFVGDEIMALWGAPVDQPDHAELAVRCALNMSDRLERLQEKWRAEGKLNIDCGIGINSGEVVIGNIGWLGKKMDYTAIGNNVNIAARIEKLTREYGTRILITNNTYDAISALVEGQTIGHAHFTPLDSVKVRGKDEAVGIYAVKSMPG